MTTDAKFETQMRVNELRRFRAEERAVIRIDAAIDAVDALAGQLCREGKTVFYINQRNAAGQMNGKTIEGTRSDLLDFVMRNPRYIAFA